jgi:tRNA-2-methylthio-N6-dimethylallyladenosine synthase
MNEVDSARMLSLLSAAEYRSAATLEEADLVLLNTCSVRGKADQKIFSELGKLRRWKQGRKGRLVGVGGCLAQQAGKSLRERAPHVDIVFGTHNIARLPELVRNAEDRTPSVEVGMDGDTRHWEVPASPPDGTFSAMVTIMQGCDNFCAYCIVPMVRGREVSRPASGVLAEIRALAARGVREVVLLGQNVNSYGRKEGEIPFRELLRRISAVEGIARIRFVTPHPRDLDDRTIGLFSEIGALCPHLHLPLQSGSDRVLSEMGRGYTRKEYLSKVAALRRARPGICFSSDFIVGFPGETEEDFRATLDVMEEVRYDSSFSFRFSPRPGTRAATMEGAVDPGTAGERLRRLQSLQDRLSRERLSGMIGQRVEVLEEGESARGGGRLRGRTPCHKTVNFAPAGGAGPLRNVLVTSAGAHSLVGEERG